MTASAQLRREVVRAVRGNPSVDRRAMGFLANFNKALDKAGVATSASVSTKLFSDTRTLNAASSENLDLSGVLTANDGTTMVLTKVHGVYVRPSSTNANAVKVGGAASNAFLGPFADATDKVSVGAGDVFLATSLSGWDVTAGTGDLLKVDNAGGAAVTYDIVIIGE